jgi:hypothetical protein
MRHDMIFRLCRVLKGMPDYAATSADELRPIVQEWHKAALPVIRTKPFGETWRDFVSAWGLVRYPAGCTLAGVREHLLRVVPDLPRADREEAGLLRLDILAELLQQKAGDGSFPLSCRKAGELCGISKSLANRLINRLVATGSLVCTSEGQRGSRPGLRAAEYRYVVPIPYSTISTGVAA